MTLKEVQQSIDKKSGCHRISPLRPVNFRRNLRNQFFFYLKITIFFYHYRTNSVRKCVGIQYRGENYIKNSVSKF